MTAARNRGRFRLVQLGGKGPNSAWAEEGSASVAEESCAGGKSSKGGGVENRSGLFGGVGFRGGHMKSQRGFEQAMFGASRIGANLRQGRVRGEDAFQDDVATDRNADYAWSRCTLSFAEDERRNSLSYGDQLSVRVAARLNATWRWKACGSRLQPLPMAAADWSRTILQSGRRQLKPLGMNLVFTGQQVNRLAAFQRSPKTAGRLMAPPILDRRSAPPQAR